MADNPQRLLTEPSFAVARRWTAAFVRWFYGVHIIALTAALGLWAALISNSSRPTWERVLIGAAQVVVLVVAFLVLVLLVCWIFSPRSQRDEVRDRLRRIDTVRGQFRLVSTGCDFLPNLTTGRPEAYPDESGELARLRIRNEGRAAKFAVLIESLEGSDKPLVHEYALLHWIGRDGALEEEIARGESRAIGIGYVLDGGMAGAVPFKRFAIQGPSGTRYNSEYKLFGGVPLTVRFVVSVRGVPDLGFTQPFEVTLTWDGHGQSIVQITRPSTDHQPQHYPNQDGIGELFDFS